jgi:ferredoxin
MSLTTTSSAELSAAQAVLGAARSLYSLFSGPPMPQAAAGKCELIYEEDDEATEMEPGQPLHKPCEAAGVPFSCIEGTCKSCLIDIKEGMENLSEYTAAEQNLLGDMTTKRLACQAKIMKGKVKYSY